MWHILCHIEVCRVLIYLETTWETGVDLARRFGPTLGVCTLESLHVACALELKARSFWTFDQRQAKLAEAVGLDTTF